MRKTCFYFLCLSLKTQSQSPPPPPPTPNISTKNKLFSHINPTDSKQQLWRTMWKPDAVKFQQELIHLTYTHTKSTWEAADALAAPDSLLFFFLGLFAGLASAAGLLFLLTAGTATGGVLGAGPVSLATAGGGAGVVVGAGAGVVVGAGAGVVVGAGAGVGSGALGEAAASWLSGAFLSFFFLFFFVEATPNSWQKKDRMNGRQSSWGSKPTVASKWVIYLLFCCFNLLLLSLTQYQEKIYIMPTKRYNTMSADRPVLKLYQHRPEDWSQNWLTEPSPTPLPPTWLNEPSPPPLPPNLTV